MDSMEKSVKTRWRADIMWSMVVWGLVIVGVVMLGLVIATAMIIWRWEV